MTTLKEALQFRIHQLSENIHAVKMAAVKREKISPRYGKIWTQDTYTWGWIDEKVVYLNPSHPDWDKYKDLKKQASIHLTCIRILKHFDGVPTKTALRKAMRAGAFLEHASVAKHVRNCLIVEAHYMLAQTKQDLSTNPTRFEEAGRYAAQRRQEASNAAKT